MKKKRHEQQTDYWQSYSDMMAALLLIFVLIIAVAFLQLQKQKADLDEQSQELEANEEELKAKEAELEESKAELEKADKELEEKRLELEEKEKKNIILKQDLEQQREKLHKIVGIKAEIIQALQKEFSKNQLAISIDSKSGSIRFQSEILFATDKSELTEAGKRYLRQAMPMYLKILMSEKYFSYVSEIVVEGNCDSTGTYEHNLLLSQDRARTVAMFCIDEMRAHFSAEQIENLLKIMNISGRSNKNIIYDANQQEDLQASRRVELKFRLKDEQMIEEMLKILEGE